MAATRTRPKSPGSASHRVPSARARSPQNLDRIISRFAPLLLVLAGVIAYANSFRGVYYFDDFISIVNNPNIRHLTPLSQVVQAPRDQPIAGRPLVAVSMAVNYAISGLSPWSYHAFNIVVHLLAALVLYGLARRTLRLPRFGGRLRGQADTLAFVIALLWTVHPLHTESVTYIAERAESMGGLLYLLTLYLAVRGITSARAGAHRRWFAGTVLACAAGMATKETLATAPVMVLAYDRIFLAGSWRRIARERAGLYAGLAATWIILAALMASSPRGGTTGFHLPDLNAWEQIRTQPGVILHYLRLVFWPYPLVLDYGWPIAHDPVRIIVPAIIVLGLLAATVAALARRPEAGFLGVWFFGILAPTSSFVPVQPLAFEHRMYLPLAAVIALVVVGLAAGAANGANPAPARARPGHALARRPIAIALAALVALLLTGRTIARNRDYADELGFWRDNVEHAPGNQRAQRNLGMAYYHLGRYQEAEAALRRAVELEPGNAVSHSNLAMILGLLGRDDEAIRHYEMAVKVKPEYPEAYTNLGWLEARRGELDAAERDLREAVRINPDLLEANLNLGAVLQRKGRTADAEPFYRRAVRIRPDYADARFQLGKLLEKLGRPDEAAEQYGAMLRLRPDDARARQALAGLGRRP